MARIPEWDIAILLNAEPPARRRSCPHRSVLAASSSEPPAGRSQITWCLAPRRGAAFGLAGLIFADTR